MCSHSTRLVYFSQLWNERKQFLFLFKRKFTLHFSHITYVYPLRLGNCCSLLVPNWPSRENPVRTLLCRCAEQRSEGLNIIAFSNRENDAECSMPRPLATYYKSRSKSSFEESQPPGDLHGLIINFRQCCTEMH